MGKSAKFYEKITKPSLANLLKTIIFIIKIYINQSKPKVNSKIPPKIQYLHSVKFLHRKILLKAAKKSLS